MTDQPHKKHGGARPGAGRPKLERPRVDLSTTVEDVTKAKLEFAALTGGSVGKVIDKLAKRLPRGPDPPS